MAESVAVERRGFTQVITINRPEARNAINGGVSTAMAAAMALGEALRQTGATIQETIR